jgi:hypothetical protein
MPFLNSVRASFSPIGRGRRMFNLATGGSTSDVANYNGTGQLWRVHSFTSAGTFTIDIGEFPFEVFMVGAGGRSDNRTALGGQSRSFSYTSLLPGSYPVTIASGGGHNLNPSGTTSFNGQSASNDSHSGAGILSNITGTSIRYGEQGAGTCNCGCCNSCCASPTGAGGAGGNNAGGDGFGCGQGGGATTRGSGGGSANGVCAGGPSQGGAVYMAYRIG